jgi:hypothetical protein
MAQGDVSERPDRSPAARPPAFFASGLIAAGCDVVTVQRALGHASATTTLNTYGHLWPDAEDRTRAATEGLMAASLDNLADYLRTERRP